MIAMGRGNTADPVLGIYFQMGIAGDDAIVSGQNFTSVVCSDDEIGVSVLSRPKAGNSQKTASILTKTAPSAKHEIADRSAGQYPGSSLQEVDTAYLIRRTI
jgi:hypothetical protein